jgi:hypothetical protein
MCTVLLPPGGYPVAVKYIISYIISYHITSYHIISIISYIIPYIIFGIISSYRIIYHIISSTLGSGLPGKLFNTRTVSLPCWTFGYRFSRHTALQMRLITQKIFYGTIMISTATWISIIEEWACMLEWTDTFVSCSIILEFYFVFLIQTSCVYEYWTFPVLICIHYPPWKPIIK